MVRHLKNKKIYNFDHSSFPEGSFDHNILSSNNFTVLNGNFANPFDESQQRYIDVYSHEKTFHNDYKIKGYNDIDLDIEYITNQDAFRSEPFEKLNSKNINIVVAGCSYTFGEGIHAENTWHSILGKKIEKLSKKPVKVYNLGVTGGSNSLAIKNILVFIKKYGKPDYIFIGATHYSRTPIATRSRHLINGGLGANPAMGKERYDALLKYMKSFNSDSAKFNFVNLMQTFEAYTNAAGITFKWFFAIGGFNDFVDDNSLFEDIFDNAIQTKHTFDFTIAGNVPLSSPRIYPNTENIPFWYIGKDGHHPGVAWHSSMADQIFESLKI